MNIVASLGSQDPLIQYTDRPTVKVIIKKDTTVLILNNGLLPGGGIDELESDKDAISRELQEELGATVKDITEIGVVIQYRNFLNKKYIIKGYTATLDFKGGLTNPQDEGEAQFSENWLAVNDALEFVSESISEARLSPMKDDAGQGRLYNLMTTYELLKLVS